MNSLDSDFSAQSEWPCHQDDGYCMILWDDRKDFLVYPKINKSWWKTEATEFNTLYQHNEQYPRSRKNPTIRSITAEKGRKEDSNIFRHRRGCSSWYIAVLKLVKYHKTMLCGTIRMMSTLALKMGMHRQLFTVPLKKFFAVNLTSQIRNSYSTQNYSTISTPTRFESVVWFIYSMFHLGEHMVDLN